VSQTGAASARPSQPLEGARRIAYDDQFGQDDGVEATLAAEEEG
jgi:hypothetical protein